MRTRNVAWIVMAGMGALLAGCAGSAENLCAEAVQHVRQCSGIDLQMPQSCDPDKAGLLLSTPCSRLSEARGIYSSWSDNGFFGDSDGSGDFSGELSSWWNDSSDWEQAGAAVDCHDLPGYHEGRQDGLEAGVDIGYHNAAASYPAVFGYGFLVGALLTCLA